MGRKVGGGGGALKCLRPRCPTAGGRVLEEKFKHERGGSSLYRQRPSTSWSVCRSPFPLMRSVDGVPNTYEVEEAEEKDNEKSRKRGNSALNGSSGGGGEKRWNAVDETLFKDCIRGGLGEDRRGT